MRAKFVPILLNILPFLFVFVASLYHPIDSDLGWHLKYGEYFIKTGHILHNNIFSTEMPNYHWVNSSWLTDIISYLAFSRFGFLGLSILAAAVVTLTFWLFSLAAKLDFYEKALIFPAAVLFLAPINSVSFRGQQLSLLLLGLLMLILRFYKESRKRLIFLIPLLFVLWSNLHGEFLLGLGVFGLWIFLHAMRELFESRNIGKIFIDNKYPAIVFVLSVLAVMVNPWGFSVYVEAAKHFGNPLEKYVVEWIPFSEQSISWVNQVIVGFAVGLGLLTLVFGNKLKQKVEDTGVFFVFYILAFIVRRFAWPMYYLSFSMLAPAVEFFKPEVKKFSTILGTVFIVIAFLVLLAADNPFAKNKNMSWDKYCKLSGCAPGAMNFLEKNGVSGNFLNTYDWGGWIIWAYPNIKPAVDGRMHLWQDENGYSAFWQYFQLESNLTDIDESKYNEVLMSKNKAMFSRLVALSKEGSWLNVYEDDFSGVFIRTKI